MLFCFAVPETESAEEPAEEPKAEGKSFIPLNGVNGLNTFQHNPQPFNLINMNLNISEPQEEPEQEPVPLEEQPQGWLCNFFKKCHERN